MILMNGHSLENINLISVSNDNFVLIIKDGKICKNTVN